VAQSESQTSKQGCVSLSPEPHNNMVTVLMKTML